MAEPARSEIRFLLNDRPVMIDRLGPTDTLLDFLRLEQRLTGTKEGCAEGDCGACTVLVGRLEGGSLAYETVTSCIRFLASLDGCHVVTVEHLAGADGSLHPVQQALVDRHGSQCGFCTPGFVMSLYALWLSDPKPARPAVEKALQGNLCRCTGYEAIVRAAEAMGDLPGRERDRLLTLREDVIRTLTGWRDGRDVDFGTGDRRIVVPKDIESLARAYAATPEATIVAGATDVGLWVTKQMRPVGPVIFIGNMEDLKAIEETEQSVTFGAGVSYTKAAGMLARLYPGMGAYMDRIGGEQIRNMGTLGGNIANGSPIGDTPPPFIALGASVALNHGGRRRTMPLEDFFIDYGQQARQPGEFVEVISIPKLRPNALFAVYKISKRRDEDISALAAAIHLTIKDGRITEARIAFGGMAATPKRAQHVEAALVGRILDLDTVEQALPAFEEDFAPLSDWRATATYRMMVAKNLLRRFVLEHGGETVTLTRHERSWAEA